MISHHLTLLLACRGAPSAYRGKQDARSADPDVAPLHTTLYDLIAALQEDVLPHDDDLVITTVMHLIQQKRLTWLKDHPVPAP